MKTKALLTSLMVLTSVQAADPISDLSRYKTWSREVLTHHDLNALQDHFADKINDVIAVTADSSYQRMMVDTLTAAHSVTVGAIEVSKTTHTHVDSHYIKAGVDSILAGGVSADSTWAISTFAHPATGYAVFSHAHTAGGDGSSGPTGAVGNVQFRSSEGGHSGSLDLSFTAAHTAGATSRLGIGIGPALHKELSIGQPTAATTDGVEILMDTDEGKNAAIEFAEDGDIYMMMTYKGNATASQRKLVIGPTSTSGDGLNINSTGEVGIETSPLTTADLTLGSKGLYFASDPGYDEVQTTAFNRWGGDPTNTTGAGVGSEAKGKGFGTANLTGSNTISTIATDAEISQAFTRDLGAVAFDNQSDSDPDLFVVYTGSRGDLLFYHDVVPGTAAAVQQAKGSRLTVHKHGISVATADRDTVGDTDGAEEALTGNFPYELYVNGSGRFTGTVQEDSDGRYKENAQSLTGALDKIKTVDAFSYEWKSDSPVGVIWADADSTVKVRSLGVSAQELKAVYPLLVKGTDESSYTVNYTRLTVVLLASIKELEARVAALEAE